MNAGRNNQIHDLGFRITWGLVDKSDTKTKEIVRNMKNLKNKKSGKFKDKKQETEKAEGERIEWNQMNEARNHQNLVLTEV